MEGIELHKQSEQKREKGNFLEALKLADEATLLYQQEGNIVGLSEVQASRYLTFAHLYEQTLDRNYLILGKFAAKSGVIIAKKSGKKEALAIPLYNYAKALTHLEMHDKAQEKYQEALDALPDSSHNKPSVVANIKIHKAVCAFQGGDSNALQEALDALKDLEESSEEKYKKDVWVSGGYMKIAEALYSSDPEKARQLLSKAGEIIDANSELQLRKAQFEKIKLKFD